MGKNLHHTDLRESRPIMGLLGVPLSRGDFARRWTMLAALMVSALMGTAAQAQVMAVEPDGTSHFVCTDVKDHFSAKRFAIGRAGVPAAFAGAMRDAATRYEISLDLLDTVARQESGYNAAAVSPKGAIGIMQLMPTTARALGVDPYEPAQNIRGGAAYLRYLLDAFDGRIDMALGAYNAGQKAILRYGGLPPYAQTRAYVAHSFDRLAVLSARAEAPVASASNLYSCP